MELNDRLKDARLKRKHLAELVGVSVSSTYNWGANPPKYVLTIISQYKILRIHEIMETWKEQLEKAINHE